MKSTKALWRISVATSAEAEDAVCELLASASGLAAAAWFDLESQISQVSVFARVREIFHPLASGGKLPPGWNVSKVSAWTPARPGWKSSG